MTPRIALLRSLAAVCVAALVGACAKKPDDTSAAVATVNGENITQDQLDYAVRQVQGGRSGASVAETALVLQNLVEQRLAAQKAVQDKLDESPDVRQAIAAAREGVLVHAFAEQVAGKVPRPTGDEVKAYYDGHPADYAQHNLYTIQKVDARVSADEAGPLAATVQATVGARAVVDLLKAKAQAVNVTQSERPAESLGPLLPKMFTMSVGQTIAIPQPQGLAALTVVGIQPQPVSLAQAQAGIEQILWNQGKRAALMAQAKDLRAKARVDYLGKFAPGTPAQPAAAPVAASTASH
jgi:EpsD family peptidyl-prolyl cis-trans isomerase